MFNQLEHILFLIVFISNFYLYVLQLLFLFNWLVFTTVWDFPQLDIP